MKVFIRRFYKALTFTAIGLLFALHWVVFQQPPFWDYIALAAMISLAWILDYFNGRASS
jgi:hypothetical protein